MTFTVQAKREHIRQDEDEVGMFMEMFCPLLTPQEQDKLSPWMQDIEDTARELFRSLYKYQLDRRDPLAVAAAAVYTSHLHVTASSEVLVPFTRLKQLTNISLAEMRSAYDHFFTRAVGLRKDCLDFILVDESMSVSDMIQLGVRHLERGVEDLTPAIKGWFKRVESKALLLAKDIELPTNMARENAALAIIYEAAHHLHGPRPVKLTLFDVGEVSGATGATVGRDKNILFRNNGE